MKPASNTAVTLTPAFRTQLHKPPTMFYYLTKNVVLLTTGVATPGGLFFLLAAFTFVVIGVKHLDLLEQLPYLR